MMLTTSDSNTDLFSFMKDNETPQLMVNGYNADSIQGRMKDAINSNSEENANELHASYARLKGLGKDTTAQDKLSQEILGKLDRMISKDSNVSSDSQWDDQPPNYQTYEQVSKTSNRTRIRL